MALIVNGFVRDVLQQLPMEFAVEAQKLIRISSKARSAKGRSSRDAMRHGAAARIAGPSSRTIRLGINDAGSAVAPLALYRAR